MVRISMLLLFVTLLFSCSSGGDDEMDRFVNSGGNLGGNQGGTTGGTMSMELMGGFVADAHPTSGTATANAEGTKLSLSNFKTDSGPKLLLYLTTDTNVTDYVDLGDLKGIEGDFEYDIPQGTDLKKHKFVVVWCVDFSVSFGHAELK